MTDPLAHTRLHFSRWRVVAGATRFYALAPGNLANGPMRESLEEAEADADRFHSDMQNVPEWMIGWGGVA